MDRDVLYDKKWFTFLRQAEMFRKIPFVDLVLASGSLVLGDVNKDSDFDVLVGVRQGRLYTARFFCLAIFKMLGWRNHIKKGRSGFCFNHFVTPAAYCLAPPYSDYDRRLYKNIKPVFGAPEKVAEFFKANAGWVNIGDVVSPQDLRHPERSRTSFFLEGFLKWLQIRKIKQNIKIYGNDRSRIICNDNEVRLWFNPKSDI